MIGTETAMKDVEEMLNEETRMVQQWKPRAVLITGDSMLYGIYEKKLRSTKVRIHTGNSLEDMYYHLDPYLLTKPSSIFLFHLSV